MSYIKKKTLELKELNVLFGAAKFIKNICNLLKDEKSRNLFINRFLLNLKINLYPISAFSKGCILMTASTKLIPLYIINYITIYFKFPMNS